MNCHVAQLGRGHSVGQAQGYPVEAVRVANGRAGFGAAATHQLPPGVKLYAPVAQQSGHQVANGVLRPAVGWCRKVVEQRSAIRLQVAAQVVRHGHQRRVFGPYGPIGVGQPQRVKLGLQGGEVFGLQKLHRCLAGCRLASQGILLIREFGNVFQALAQGPWQRRGLGAGSRLGAAEDKGAAFQAQAHFLA